MRDPDNQAPPQQRLDERDARPDAGAALSWGFEGQATEPRYALGTQQGHWVGPPGPASENGAFDLTAISRASLVFDAGGRIADLNMLAEALLGYLRADLVGEPIDLFVSKLVTVEQPAPLRYVSASAGACVRHRSGRAIPVEALLCPHDAGSTIAVLCAVETTEAGLREEDVAQIVHDLKNPLSTIALEACLLDDKLAHGTPSDMRGALARITHNVEFLDRMVHDLLDLCSLEAGRLELQRRPTDLRALLEQIIDRVVATRDRGRVFLHTEGPLTISIDELRIERVIANLLENALKYAPSTSGVVIRLAAVNDTARVSVSDAGPGMTAAETGYVFDKFRRASTASGHEGSGLGLYVSKKIVEAHGGRIDVTSARGVGSQFSFELPAT